MDFRVGAVDGDRDFVRAFEEKTLRCCRSLDRTAIGHRKTSKSASPACGGHIVVILRSQKGLAAAYDHCARRAEISKFLQDGPALLKTGETSVGAAQ